MRRNFVFPILSLVVVGGCVTERVLAPETAFTVAPQLPLVQVGMVIKIAALFPDEGAAPASAITWTSSEPTIATVDLNGLVTAVARGKAVITARSGDVAESTTVSVRSPDGTTIVSGGSLTCGITVASDAVCFGDNTFGQTGTVLSATTLLNPTPVIASVKWQSLSASWNHACGVDSQSDIYCWGLNASGQLGMGTQSEPVRPSSRVAGNNKWVAVSAGGSRWLGGNTDIELNDAQETCALNREGSAYCWGARGNTAATGEIPSSTPVAAAPGIHFAAISVGAAYVCGIAFDRQAYCWGNNELGQLGRAQVALDRSPKPVEGGLKFTAISAGGIHACGLTTDSTVYCWGGNDALQLGAQTTQTCTYRNVTIQCQTHPIAVPGGYKFLSIAAGGWPQALDPKNGSHTCGVSSTNDVVCWGDNQYGQVRFYRDDLSAPRSRPPTVAELAGIKFRAVSTGSSHTCGVTLDGRAYCWGDRPSFAPGGSGGGFRVGAMDGGFTFK